MTMALNFVFITNDYFCDKKAFVEMLDPNDAEKQSSRFYLYIAVKYNDNYFYVPLRKRVDLNIGNIGYSVPSSTKPRAGLDYRKALIINDEKYIKKLEYVDLSSSQMKKITTEIIAIEKSFARYVAGYVKAVIKKREKIDRLYKFSTLHNFHHELGLI
jgi:protein AbiQ